MHLDIDRFSGYDSPLHRWDARFRIVSLFALIIVTSLIKDPYALALSVFITASIFIISSIPPAKIIKTLLLPAFLLIPLFILLPLTSGGTPVYFYGIKFYEEGAALSVLIAVKAVSIITLFILLAGTSPFHTTLKALRSLRVPDVMADIILFSYRYIHLYINDLRTMRQSLVLRGYKNTGTLRGLRTSAYVAGTLLVRSSEQTERIFDAMTCRGYPGSGNGFKYFKAGTYDYIKSAAAILAAAAVLWLELYF